MLSTSAVCDQPSESGSISPGANRTRKWLWCIIVPAAALLRFLFLSHKSLWLDETASAFIAGLSWRQFGELLWRREANMALYYVILRPVLHLGSSEFWLRLPAVLAGIAAVPLMYVLGKRVFDRRIGLLAAVLLAVSSCHVVYSQEARAYSLVVLLSMLSWLFFLRGMENPSRKNWLWYVITSTLAVYSHFFAVWVLVAQLLSLLVLPRRSIVWNRLIPAELLTGILLSPLAVMIARHNEGQLQWVPKASALEIYHAGVLLAGEGGRAVGKMVLVLAIAALVQAARGGVAPVSCVGAGDEDARTTLGRWRQRSLWVWLLAPIALCWLISLLITPILAARFLLICLPPFLLLSAKGLASFRAGKVLIPLFVLLSLISVGVSYTRPREDWRAATAFVISHAQPGEAVAFYQPFGEMAFRYYENHAPANSLHLQHVRHDPAGFPGYHRLWMVFYSTLPPNPSVLARRADMAAKYRVVEDASFRAIRVTLFERAEKK